MATQGKKNKKVKRKAVPLQDFLGGDAANQVTAQVTRIVAPASWVDECDEDEIEYNRPLQAFSLPTAPRASRAMDDVPEVAPFIAHLSNLPFDVDDEDIYDFFSDQQVEQLRLPREDGGGRSRGFGYIEFKTRTDLIAALMMPDPHVRNRRIRIDVSTESDQKRGSGGRYGRDSGFGDTSNWRKEGAGGGGGGGFGSGRDEDGGGRGRSYGGGGGGFGRDREQRDWPSSANEEGGNWRDNMKKRSDSPPPMVRRSGAYGGDRGDRERDGERGGGGGGGSRDRYMGRGSGGRYGDEQGGSAGGLQRSTIAAGRDADDATDADQSAERPKLVLQKRTLPMPEIKTQPEEDGGEADEAANGADGEAAGAPAKEAERVLARPLPAADIFGAAKPVDTAARERAMEERLERERVEREEAAEVARRVRAEAAEAAEVARAEAAAAGSAAEKGSDSGAATTSPSSDGSADKGPEADASAVATNGADGGAAGSWRRKTQPEEGEEDGADGGRRQSPDRRVGGGGRREYNTDRRNNADRDYQQRRDGERNYQQQPRDNRGRNNDGYGRGGAGAGRDNNSRDDRPLRRSNNNDADGADENAAPREPQEPRMPKYKEPTNVKLATTNAFEFLDEEGGSD